MNQLDQLNRLMTDTHNALLKTEDANTVSLLRTYQTHLSALIQDLTSLNSQIEKPSIGQWRKLGLDQASERLIAQRLSTLHDVAVAQMSKDLVGMFQYTYDRTSYVIDQTTPPNVDINYQLPTAVFIQEYMDKPWKGEKFSDRIWSINTNMARQLQSILTSGMQSGDSTQTMAKAMRSYTGVPDGTKLITRPRASAQLYRATLIARTEMIRASRLAQKKVFSDNSDLMTGEVWTMAPGGIRVCDDCLERNGKTRDWIENNADDDLDTDPPGHPMCILPGNKIIIPDAVSATKAFYRGPVVEFTTNGGSKLTVTENHEILTTLGWMKAKFLNEGSEVISAIDGQGIAKAINPNYQDTPTAIEKIFSSFEKSPLVLPVSMKTTSEDFHGDGRFFDGDVNVVSVNRLLRSRIKIANPFEKLLFGKGKIAWITLAGLRNLATSFIGLLLTPDCVMCGLGQSKPFGFSGFGHSNEHGLGTISRFDPRTQEPTTDTTATDAKRAREFQLRFARLITAKKITSIKKYSYEGHVYDLQSEFYGLYNCEGVMVKNCRCLYFPQLKSWKELLGDEGEGMEDMEHLDEYEMKHPQTTTMAGSGGGLVNMSVEPYENWSDSQ